MAWFRNTCGSDISLVDSQADTDTDRDFATDIGQELVTDTVKDRITTLLYKTTDGSTILLQDG